MKLPSLPLIAALCCAASAATPGPVQVYVYDTHADLRSPEHPLPALSPVAARMVMAQRMGVEDYHSVDLSNAEAVRALNEYGQRSGLFQERTEPVIARALYYVEATHEDIKCECFSASLITTVC